MYFTIAGQFSRFFDFGSGDDEVEKQLPGAIDSVDSSSRGERTVVVVDPERSNNDDFFPSRGDLPDGVTWPTRSPEVCKSFTSSFFSSVGT